MDEPMQEDSPHSLGGSRESVEITEAPESSEVTHEDDRDDKVDQNKDDTADKNEQPATKTNTEGGVSEPDSDEGELVMDVEDDDKPVPKTTNNPLDSNAVSATSDKGSMNKSGSDMDGDSSFSTSPRGSGGPSKSPGSSGKSVSPGKKDSEGMNIPTGDIKMPKRKNVDPRWLTPFSEGWRREIVLRNTYDEGKSRAADVYYYSPNKGPKLRSNVQIGKYLEKIGNFSLGPECFTFVKETIHEPPSEYVRVAGKSTFGRPKNSPGKSPTKTPVMKQKKSPFAKSPLSLKKTAMGLVTSPTGSPNKPFSSLLKATQKFAALERSKFVVVKKSVQVPTVSSPVPTGIINVVRASDTGSGPTGTSPAVSGVHYVKIVPPENLPKKPMAKKHTGKRPVPGGGDDPALKKFKTATSGTGTQRMCGMDCPGRHGVPPSLPCTVCMCMFHPECVSRGVHQQLEGFMCKSCKLVTKKISSDNNNEARKGSPAPRPVGHPPNLGRPRLPAPGLQKLGGPPPLKAAPTAQGSSVLRQPPPLRMAPVANSSVQPSMAPPPLQAQTGIVISKPGATVNLSGIQAVVRSQAPLTIQPQVNGGLVVPPVVTLPMPTVSNLTVPTVTTLPVQGVGTLPTVAPPIRLNLPPAVPKDVSGQILALPSNVTSKLDMDKPVALKVNGQSYIIPPHCFINTQDGAKIYLPPGYLPNVATQGPSSALSVNLNSNPSKEEQLLNITPLSELKDAADKGKSTASKEGSVPKASESSAPKPKKSRPSRKPDCPIQQLHVGYDCMVLIFSYLKLSDLLRAKQVCKTWKRVATQHCMWKHVQLRGYWISDWDKAAKMLQDMHTQTLDLRGLQHRKDNNRTWHQFTSILPNLIYLRRVDFGQCPSTVLHAVTEKLVSLQAITAEFITDTMQESQMWTSNAKLDIGKFSKLKDLEELKLRGLCGLAMPAFSFSGGLAEFSALTNLRRLSLTTLRDVSEEDFSFIASLTKLEELELGDLSSWKAETYDQLSLLTNLRSLRLECGIDYKEGGLGQAIQSLPNLKNLELIKFAISQSLTKALPKVKSLQSLSIWPDTENKAAHVNTCTLRAITDMTSLAQLDWGIMIDTTTTSGSSNNHDDASQDSNSSNSSGGPSTKDKQPDCIPILPANIDILSADQENDEDEDLLEYLSINQLVDRLCNHLPDTKIRVFKVPVVTPKVSTKAT